MTSNYILTTVKHKSSVLAARLLSVQSVSMKDLNNFKTHPVWLARGRIPIHLVIPWSFYHQQNNNVHVSSKYLNMN